MKLRDELRSQLSQQTATEEQVISAAAYVQKILDHLPQATLTEKRQVIESIDAHVVHRDAEHMRIFFDLPGEETDEFRWKGPESLASIQ